MHPTKGFETAITALRQQFVLPHYLAPQKPVAVIATTIPHLDTITSIGGIPRGYFTEIFGETGSGKTFLCMLLMKQAQQQHLECVYFNPDGDFDFDMAESVGVHIDPIMQIHSNGENLSRILTTIMPKVGLIIIDSLAQIPFVQNHAEGIKNLLRDCLGAARQYQVAIVATNHYYGASIAPFSPNTPGGYRVRCDAALRISLATKDLQYENNQIKGQWIEATVVQNVFSPQIVTTRYLLDFSARTFPK